MRIFALLLLIVVGAHAQQPRRDLHPRDQEIHDADTLAWWHTTEALSGDDMEGRDTGSSAYQRAAEYVAGRFRAAGLQPAGEKESFFQPVAVHEVAVDAAGTSIAVVQSRDGESDRVTPVEFLQQITITPAANLPAEAEAPLTFRGYCGKDAMKDTAGKIVVCFGTQRDGLPSAAERAANGRAGGALGLINVDDPYFTIEPPRWPAAYARTVTLAGAGGSSTPLLVMRLKADVLASLIAGSGKDAAAILAMGGHKQPLESFDIPAKLRVKLHVTQRDYSSPNVIAMLPGSDAALKDQVVVIAAHLDGYGFGTPVNGDNLYNGALDDAAYVALLIRFAENVKAGRLPVPKRSVLICAFMGEEKGLLGSNYFVAHPTVPVSHLVADINLDQLRPLFPLKILTAEAIDDTTLGDIARMVGAGMGITLRPDMEPERGLLHRADQYPFLRLGVPAISFVFGFDSGTDAERRYREWYNVRYHRPQDDLTQPMDFDAAAKFDEFFYKLTEAIANSPEKPAFKPGSSFVAKTGSVR